MAHGSGAKADVVSMMHDFLISAAVLVVAVSPRIAAWVLLGSPGSNGGKEAAPPVPAALRPHLVWPVTQVQGRA